MSLDLQNIDFAVFDTGYTERLRDRTYQKKLREEFEENAEEPLAKNLTFGQVMKETGAIANIYRDSRMGDAAFLTYNTLYDPVIDQIFDKLTKTGLLIFKLKGKSIADALEIFKVLKNADYCTIYGIDNMQSFKISGNKSVIVLEADSESG